MQIAVSCIDSNLKYFVFTLEARGSWVVGTFVRKNANAKTQKLLRKLLAKLSSCHHDSKTMRHFTHDFSYIPIVLSLSFSSSDDTRESRRNYASSTCLQGGQKKPVSCWQNASSREFMDATTSKQRENVIDRTTSIFITSQFKCAAKHSLLPSS